MTPADVGGSSRGFRYLPGSAKNLVRHPVEQKWKSRPSCAAWCGDVAGSTFMPQTGSIAGPTATDAGASISASDGRVSAVMTDTPTRYLPNTPYGYIKRRAGGTVGAQQQTEVAEPAAAHRGAGARAGPHGRGG